MPWNKDSVGLPENFTVTGVTQEVSENLDLVRKFPQLKKKKSFILSTSVAFPQDRMAVRC